MESVFAGDKNVKNREELDAFWINISLLKKNYA